LCDEKTRGLKARVRVPLRTPKITLLLGRERHKSDAGKHVNFMKTTLKLKLNIMQANLGHHIYPLKPSAGLLNLVRLSFSVLLERTNYLFDKGDEIIEHDGTVYLL
jgi:hypothetical protein